MSRASEFMALHDSGKTYADIGEMHGISKERVRQIIRKEYPSDGRYMTKANVKPRRSMDVPDGVSVKEAATILGVEYQQARVDLVRMGVKYEKYKEAKWKARLLELKKLSDQGLNQAEAARNLGISPQYVCNILRKSGFKWGKK